MAKESRIHQLNEQLELLLNNTDAFSLSADAELGPLLQIATDLRHLPSENFKSQLKTRLAHQARRMSESFITKTESKGKTMRSETLSLTPYLVVKNAAQAIEFYKNALGATEMYRLQEPDGRIGHAELTIGKSLIMLADEFPEYGILSAQTIGQSPVSIHLYVENADNVVERAYNEGARILMPVQDQFYGDRAGRVQDPFGHIWHVSQHKEEVTPQEMQRRLDELTKAGSAESWKKPVHYIPEGLRSVTPYLHVSGAGRFIEFLKKAFQAEEIEREGGPDGLIMHAKVRVGNSVIEMGDSRGEIQPMPAALHLYVPDVDSVYRIALEAGATSIREPQDMFYGDREASVQDPFGNHWYIATHIKDV
jgi:PhnB protein